MFKLLIYIKNYKKECILGPTFKLLEAALELTVPLIMAKIIDYGIANNDMTYITKMCILLAFLGMVGLLSSVTAQFFAAKASVGFCAKLRHVLLSHTQTLSYTDLDTIGTATLITRMTSDINQVQTGVNLTLRLLLRSPFVVFGAMIMAFTVNHKIALIFAGVIAALCIVVFGIMLFTIPMYRDVQGKLDDVTAKTRENLTGVRVIRAFCKEKDEKKEFSQKNGILTGMQTRVGAISAVMNPLTYVIINFAVIILLREGAVKINYGAITQGQMVALYNYMSQILVELVKMAVFIITLTKSVACGNRIQSILDIMPAQSTGKVIPGNRNGQVVFNHVSVRYKNGGDEALTDIDFTAPSGSCIGIIGGTGSGKTTLVNLIPGFYEPSEGYVTVDGVNICEFDKNELRKRIGIVPQKALLFKGTIRENLLWGDKNADDETIKQALDISQAYEIVKNKENGLDYKIEQVGENLSGGQRQRLTIARAMVKKPEILILDDSASALDYATDARLRMAIRNMSNPPTTFIVSQRAASVRYSDLIIVLDDGKIVGKGTHDELIDSCDVYREIYYSQFSEEAQ